MSRSKRFLFAAVTLALVATGLSFAIWAPPNRGDERAGDGATAGASSANEHPANSSAPGERAHVLISENQNASSGATRPRAAVANKEQPARIAVGPNVHVSADRADFLHFEVILAAHSKDPRHLLAGSKISYGPGDVNTHNQSIAYWSDDGGKTWRVTLEKKFDKIASDPAVAFGPDGSAYFATLRFQGVDLFRSHDCGKSWELTTTIGRGVFLDRPFLAVDHTDGKYHGRLYCNCEFRPPLLDETETRGQASNVDGCAVYSSEDAGKTFRDPPAWRIANPPYREFGCGHPLVLSDGTLVAPYTVIDMNHPENQPRGEVKRAVLCVLRSVDGGKSFERGTRVSDWHLDKEDGFPCYAAAPKGAPGEDRLYAAWSDTRGGRHQVLLAHSADKGLTWSKWEVVSDGAGADGKDSHALLPAVAVSKDGVVGVSWYDTRDIPPGRSGWDVRFRASTDGGKTWLPSVRVSQKSSLFKKGRGSLGETAGLAADAEGAFHVLWVDNRTGVQQVWTARLTVQRSK
jgi:BNR/Asp-box repeat